MRLKREKKAFMELCFVYVWLQHIENDIVLQFQAPSGLAKKQAVATSERIPQEPTDTSGEKDEADEGTEIAENTSGVIPQTDGNVNENNKPPFEDTFHDGFEQDLKTKNRVNDIYIHNQINIYRKD